MGTWMRKEPVSIPERDSGKFRVLMEGSTPAILESFQSLKGIRVNFGVERIKDLIQVKVTGFNP